MADATLQITTVVDTSQLEAGMQKATAVTNAYTQSATLGFRTVKEASDALASAQEQLGAAAAAGNTQAAAVIAEYEAAVATLKSQIDAETASVTENTEAHIANNGAVSAGISERQAASASLRTLELNMQGSTRAAGAFLTSVLGLGPVLQAAFPVIGAIALGEVLLTVGERVYTLYQNIVNLKAEIAALGEASEKTAKQAADANWKWIESQYELLKSQGKLKEAQEFLASHSGDKPETLSLGVDTSKLKDLPDDMRAFAETLNQVHTQAQAQSVFKELDGQMASTQGKLAEFRAKITELQSDIQRREHNPTGSDAEAAALGADAERIDSLQHQITAYTEYSNALQNIKNKNVSDSAAEGNKVLQASESVLRQQEALDQSGLAAHKSVADAQVALDEETAKRQLQTGQITAQQELAQLAADTQKKLQIEIDYLSQLDSILSRDADKNAGEITRNRGRIQALKLQQQTEALKSQQEADAEALNSMLRSIDAEIEGTKTGSQQRIDLIRQEVLLVSLLYGEQGAEYEKMLGKLQAADRERTAELQRQTTQQLELQLRSIKEASQAEEQATEQAIRDRQREAAEDNRVSQQGLQGQARNANRLGLPDIGRVEALYAQMQAQEEAYTQRSIQLAKEEADAKVAALKRIEDAAELAALADPANSAKFIQDAQEAANKQVAIEQELQSKLAQLRQQGAERSKQIDQQLAQAKIQEEQRISQRMLQFENQALFQSKSFGDAVTKIYKGLAQSAIDSLLQMVNRWVTEHIVMEVATRLFHIRTAASAAAADAQKDAQTIGSNVIQVTSNAALAASAAYAAYAEFPPVAAAMAAEAEASVLAFLPEASAEGGYDIPSGVNPILQAHAREMVLPEEHADTIRGLADIVPQIAMPSFQRPELPESAMALARGDFGGSITNVANQSSSEQSGGDFHYHAGDNHAHALDGKGVGQVLRSNRSEVTKELMKMYKGGHFSKR